MDKKPGKGSKKTEDLFSKYKEPKEDKIGATGIEKFFQDLGVDLMDPVTLVISYMCKAQTMGQYTKTEFATGMAELKCESIVDLKNSLKSIRGKLDNEKDFREIYKFTFSFAKESTARNLAYESAVALWQVLCKNNFPFLNKWLEFLDKRPTKTDVTKDVWNMILEFHYTTQGDISKYTDDGAWPVLIDEFVAYLNEKN